MIYTVKSQTFKTENIFLNNFFLPFLYFIFDGININFFESFPGKSQIITSSNARRCLSYKCIVAAFLIQFTFATRMVSVFLNYYYTKTRDFLIIPDYY